MRSTLAFIPGGDAIVYLLVAWLFTLVFLVGGSAWIVGRTIEHIQELVYKQTEGRAAKFQQFGVPVIILLAIDGASLASVIPDDAEFFLLVSIGLFPIASFVIPFVATREFFACGERRARVIFWCSLLAHSLVGALVLTVLGAG